MQPVYVYMHFYMCVNVYMYAYVHVNVYVYLCVRVFPLYRAFDIFSVSSKESSQYVICQEEVQKGGRTECISAGETGTEFKSH